MTDIMKLATAYATSAQVDGRHDFDSSKTAKARAALQAAIEALQVECAEHKENAMRNARIAVNFRSQLEAMQRQEPVIDFTVLHQFANDQAISYNKLCTAVRMCLAAPKALAPEQVEAAWRAGWAACRDAEYVGQEAENEAWGMSQTCESADWENASPKALAPLERVAECAAAIESLKGKQA